MTRVDDKLAQLQILARMRQAQQRYPRDRDLAAGYGYLERQVGEAVSGRLAARFLQVSHTALQRWIRSGDIPLVYARDGRQQVPVNALLELRESIQQQRAAGRNHVLEPIVNEGRRRAERISVAASMDPNKVPAHRRAEATSLAYHREVARRLNRAMSDEALRRVWKWRDEAKIDPRYADEWESILSQPLTDVRNRITEDSSRGRDLRQNSPFAGMLSEPERRRILEAVGYGS